MGGRFYKVMAVMGVMAAIFLTSSVTEARADHYRPHRKHVVFYECSHRSCSHPHGVICKKAHHKVRRHQKVCRTYHDDYRDRHDRSGLGVGAKIIIVWGD